MEKLAHFRMKKIAKAKVLLIVTLYLGIQACYVAGVTAAATTCQNDNMNDNLRTITAEIIANLEVKRCKFNDGGEKVDTLRFSDYPQYTQKLEDGITLGKIVMNNLQDKLSLEVVRKLYAIPSANNAYDTVAVAKQGANEKQANGEQIGMNNKYILIKSMYLAKGVNVEKVTVEGFASKQYTEACLPPNASLWDWKKSKDDFGDNVVSFQLSLIPFFLSPKIRLMVEELDLKIHDLSFLPDYVTSDKSFMLSRVRSNAGDEDSIKIVKTLVILSNVKNGVLVTQYTVIISSLPAVGAITGIIQSFANGQAVVDANRNASAFENYFNEK